MTKNNHSQFGKWWWATQRVSKHVTIFSYRVEMALTSNQSRLAIKK